MEIQSLDIFVRRGCKQSGQLARVKQREWKRHRVDTIKVAPAIAASPAEAKARAISGADSLSPASQAQPTGGC
jgi:hypothetical protein